MRGAVNKCDVLFHMGLSIVGCQVVRLCICAYVFLWMHGHTPTPAFLQYAYIGVFLFAATPTMHKHID